jgi:hypothetical protein
LRNRVSFSSGSLVQSLSVESVNWLRHNLFKGAEYDRGKFVSQERWQIIHGSVNPSVQEVVVTVGKAFSLEEPFLSITFVEL